MATHDDLKVEEKDEVAEAYQDETLDAAKQHAENSQVSAHSAMTRKILLKLDIRFVFRYSNFSY